MVPPPSRPVPGVIAIGASAGGIEALQRLMRELPQDLAVAICLVLHIHVARPQRVPVDRGAHGQRRLAVDDLGEQAPRRSRYRCRVGHVLREDVLIDGKAAAVAQRLTQAGRAKSAQRMREQARGAEERAELIRGVLAIDEGAGEQLPAGDA